MTLPPNMTTALAAEEDAPALASIMTAAFSASDAAYPLIWNGPAAPKGIHDVVVIKGLFSPVQKEGRLTFKAMDGENIVGFATWTLPKSDTPRRTHVEKRRMKPRSRTSSVLPEIPGVSMALWSEMVDGLKEASDRDVELSEDILLSLFFVHPDFQRRGIGTLLLQWGLKKADELKAKLWLSSTPQAVTTYEKNGWKVVQRYDVDLGKYRGFGIYSRAWMLRQPRETVEAEQGSMQN